MSLASSVHRDAQRNVRNQNMFVPFLSIRDRYEQYSQTLKHRTLTKTTACIFCSTIFSSLVEEMEDDADALPQALEQFAETARAQVSARSVDTLLLAAITEIATRAEAAILQHRYDRVSLHLEVMTNI